MGWLVYHNFSLEAAVYPSRHWLVLLLLCPVLVVVPAVRGQGWKGKAGAWPPSSLNFLSVTTTFSNSQGVLYVRADIEEAASEGFGVSTSEMCMCAATGVLCVSDSSLNHLAPIFLCILYTSGYQVEINRTCLSTGCTCDVLSRSNSVSSLSNLIQFIFF